ncbi:hypothetical protein SCLCIDRAFT_1224270 [Scleroderma citrinum Foug A]|uniref:Uncharacterized protein n=1 Tax=Scleroderma citrinum Foug A TaxID=1036808 RepID=A0A0C3D5M0_9AGAM|nr:hypothetical protein SCLCIDRAFT_1224270 [Scleroderma citrinum Foug A]
MDGTTAVVSSGPIAFLGFGPLVNKPERMPQEQISPLPTRLTVTHDTMSRAIMQL